MRQLFRCDYGETDFIVAPNADRAFQMCLEGMLKSGCGQEEAQEYTDGLTPEALQSDEEFTFRTTSGIRVVLPVQDWLDMLPDGEFVFASTLF